MVRHTDVTSDKSTALNVSSTALLAALCRVTMMSRAKRASVTCDGAVEMIRSLHTCVHKPKLPVKGTLRACLK